MQMSFILEIFLWDSKGLVVGFFLKRYLHLVYLASVCLLQFCICFSSKRLLSQPKALCVLNLGALLSKFLVHKSLSQTLILGN